MNRNKKHGPWTVCSTAQVYRDPFIDVTLDQVIRPDGIPGQHVVVELKAGVCVLPIDEENRIYLTKEFHYGIGRDSLEGVSGGIEQGEEGLLTAQRELAEELGLSAASWKSLTTVDPFTTVVVSPTQLFIARGLAEVALNPEGTERIERVVMPLVEAVNRVISGEITHAPTCVLIFWAAMSQESV